MIMVVCPGCHRQLQLDDKPGGREGKCAHCGHHVRFAATPPDPAQATADTASERGPAVASDPNLPPQKQASAPGYEFLAAPQRPDEIGRLGSYRILQRLGQGAMGMVFRAEDPGLGRIVALKVMLPAVAAVEENRVRFLREAQAAGQLNHPNVIAIYQVGEDRGVPFLAMPLLKGESLEARLNREKKMSIGDAVRIAREMAEGLAAAHERGLVHRDIKPANLWLEAVQRRHASDRLKLLDFGLARVDDSGLTQAGAILGTPAYMAPEQARGQPVDHRCDLYSLGGVLYRMLTGERPFPGNDQYAVLLALTTTTPIAPHELNPAVPPGLSRLVMRLLEKSPESRPQSAGDVIEELNRLGLAPGSGSTDRMPVFPGGSSGTLPAFLAGSVEVEATRVKPDDANAGSSGKAIPLGLAALVLLALCLLAYWARDFFQENAPPPPSSAAVTGTLTLTVQPADALVLVGFERKSSAMTGTYLLDLDPGTHRLQVSKDGFRTETRALNVVPGSNEPISVVLEKATQKPPPPPPEKPVPPVVEPKDDARSKDKDITAPSNPKGLVAPPARPTPPPDKESPKGAEKPKPKGPMKAEPIPPRPIPRPMPPPVPPPAPDGAEQRAAAQWVLASDGRVEVKRAGDTSSIAVKSLKMLPAGRFDVVGIDLGNSKALGGDALTKVAGLKNVAILNLTGTNVTDAGLAPLQGMSGLNVLVISQTGITDAAVPYLKGLQGLGSLDLEGTKISAAGVKELRDALPRCAIIPPRP